MAIYKRIEYISPSRADAYSGRFLFFCQEKEISEKRSTKKKKETMHCNGWCKDGGRETCRCNQVVRFTLMWRNRGRTGLGRGVRKVLTTSILHIFSKLNTKIVLPGRAIKAPPPPPSLVSSGQTYQIALTTQRSFKESESVKLSTQMWQYDHWSLSSNVYCVKY